MNILIIEDDEFLGNKIRDVFNKRVISNKITLLSTFEEFIHELAVIQSYDIILVDIKLGFQTSQSGLDIVKIIRKKQLKMPIIVMSGFDDIEYIENAFNLGANDYLTKPFRLKELELRIMRWFKSYCINIICNDTQVLNYHGLSYKFHENTFYYNDELIELSKKSKFILFQFLLRKEHIISESDLCLKLWGDRELLKNRNIRIVILRLKKILEEFNIDNWIKNIRGEGYILKK